MVRAHLGVHVPGRPSRSLPALLALACQSGSIDERKGDDNGATDTGDGGDTGDTGDSGDPEPGPVSAGDLACTPPAESDIASLEPANLPQGPSPCRAPVLARVTGVTDGDTFDFRPVAGGSEQTVRVVGVDTPETWDGEECFGPEASDFAHAALEDRLVWLTFDSDCEDLYGRQLAYVLLSDDDACFWERLLLRGGYAETMEFEATSTFADLFDADQAWAESSSEGMWEACF